MKFNKNKKLVYYYDPYGEISKHSFGVIPKIFKQLRNFYQKNIQ